jgi:hypothetical protein
MGTTWKIQADWDRDGTFDHPQSLLTDWVIKANWFLGMRRPYEAMAHKSSLRLVLNNADRRFSPENEDGPLFGLLKPSVPVRIISHDGTTERVMRVGRIQTIQPRPGGIFFYPPDRTSVRA